MRRGVGLALIGIGAFLIVLAPLAKFVVAPAVMKYPADQYGQTHLTAENARYFSIGDLKVLTGTLAITVTTRGDVAESKDGHVVWDQVTATNDVTNNKPLIDLTEFRSAFNNKNGVGVNCCGVNIDKQPVQLDGQIFLFPFGVQKKAYKVFNTSTGKAYDANFVAEESIDGLKVYKFQQTIPPTTIQTLNAPASVLGMTQTGDIQVNRVYDGVTTFWIEPTTGAPIKQEQQRHEVLKTADGVERMPAFIGTAQFTPQSIADQVKTVKEKVSQLTLITTTIPLVSLIVGIVLLAAGIFLRRAPKA